MSILLAWSILAIHYSLLVVLCLFGLHRLSMVLRWLYYSAQRSSTAVEKLDDFPELPTVTVQIPVYNERNVANRIIERVIRLDYPRENLQIQVVDDSTDDTQELIAQQVNELQALGHDIQHVHRTNRHGYKAGALRDAMAFAKGEFIAIFDADFLPPVDFLTRSIHRFTNPKLAMLQGRWGHLNRDRNRLTRTQAMMLDSHFALEQQVRYQSNMLFNFNGTAGIWRTEAIIDAGHWSADTLTEDLDLSYRAQLKGWELEYMNDLVCPAELPSDMPAFKSQQHRWAKGGIQVMLKMLQQVWRSHFSLAKKLESTFHLSNNFAYFVMLLDTLLLLIPSLFAREFIDNPLLFWFDIPLLLLSSGSHLVYLYFGQVALHQSRKEALVNLPWLLLLGVRLAFNNARAALEAILGQESEFVRTPKSGEELTSGRLKLPNAAKAYVASLPATEGAECVAALIFIIAVIWALVTFHWYMLPFLSLLAVGFSASAAASIRNKVAMR